MLGEDGPCPLSLPPNRFPVNNNDTTKGSITNGGMLEEEEISMDKGDLEEDSKDDNAHATMTTEQMLSSLRQGTVVPMEITFMVNGGKYNLYYVNS